MGRNPDGRGRPRALAGRRWPGGPVRPWSWRGGRWPVGDRPRHLPEGSDPGLRPGRSGAPMAVSEGAIGIHLLGAADLGEGPEKYPQRLRDFLAAPLEGRVELLLRTRQDAHQSALPPIGSFLYHAPEPLTELWLVATNQIDVLPDDWRRRGDTLALARGIREVLEQRPALYGAACSVRVLEVRRFALRNFAGAVREEL